MSFSKTSREKILDDLLLKMVELSERTDLSVEEHCRVAEVIVQIMEIQNDNERRCDLETVTNKLMNRMGLTH